ncbi:MAG: glycosyltransferase family 4 protein [Cyanobacteria bacterium P01_D01_bin.56]
MDDISLENKQRLRILMLHNRYQYLGGEDVSTLEEVDLLRRYGHFVRLAERTNDDIEGFSVLQKIDLFLSSAWSTRSTEWLRSKLEELSSLDLLHVQNFFPLFSPSVHQAAKKKGIPTVQHLRNFRLGCLNAYLFREGRVCEVCVGHNPWQGVRHRCYRQSLAASLSVWQMIMFNRLRRTWYRDVDAFITPSQFAANKLVEIGIPEERLYVKPNFLPDPLIDQQILPLPQRPTFLYLGRLSPEKGLLTVLKAWQQLSQSDWQLLVVGDGAQRIELANFCVERQLVGVSFLGYQPKSAVVQLIQQATAVLVPSLWYETFGRVVVEAFACGRPVLVSDLGALTELVEEGKTGFRIKPGEVFDWQEKLQWAADHPIGLARMGQMARHVYLEKYTPEINYKYLMEIYDRVLR